MTAAVWVYLIGAFADTWTTNKGLELGAKEFNPAVRWFMDKFPGESDFELMVLKLGYLAAVCWLFAGAAQYWTLMIAGVLQILVAARNYQVVRKLGG